MNESLNDVFYKNLPNNSYTKEEIKRSKHELLEVIYQKIDRIISKQIVTGKEDVTIRMHSKDYQWLELDETPQSWQLSPLGGKLLVTDECKLGIVNIQVDLYHVYPIGCYSKENVEDYVRKLLSNPNRMTVSFNITLIDNKF